MSDGRRTGVEGARQNASVSAHSGGDGDVHPGDDAAREALMRATRAARDAGLRPGMTPRRRRRRPVETTASNSGPDRRDPQLLGAGVEKLVAQRGWGEDLSAATVMGNWAVIAGLEIAAHSSPVSFEDGILTVRAESTAWATQLTYLVPNLQARIDEAVGTGVVASIRVNGPSAPSWRKGTRRVMGRGPRDTYG